MKIVVIGGTGLIGSQVLVQLTELGHEAVSASPRSGVNTLTGDGLAEALADAHTVVDVSNSPSWADDDVLNFFTTSTRNLLAAERAARRAAEFDRPPRVNEHPSITPRFVIEIGRSSLDRDGGYSRCVRAPTKLHEGRQAGGLLRVGRRDGGGIDVSRCRHYRVVLQPRF